MISSLSKIIDGRRLILASQSPRRREILSECGLIFEVIPSSFEENLCKDNFATPAHYVMETARQKALQVFQQVAGTNITSTTSIIVVGCDTVVVNEGKILEKPSSAENAIQMLESLSGNDHFVFSGVAIISSIDNVNTDQSLSMKEHVFYDETTVTFGQLSHDDIKAYVATGECMDKAGAYGIQGKARCWVERIDGCYNNVVGFPLQRFSTELQRFISLLT